MTQLAQSLICILLPHLIFSQSAEDVIRKADQKMRGDFSQAELVIRITRPTWTRDIYVKTWSYKKDFSLILITAPAREKGIVYLKRGKEVWNWLPKLERTIKLPPSMMSQSWMGTDFSNDDLVKESSLVDDYIHHFAGDTFFLNRHCKKILCLPKPNAAVVWGKLLIYIDDNDFLELCTEFYDDENNLIQTMYADQIQTMDDRVIPTHLVMIPTEKNKQKTEIFYRQIWFSRKIDLNLFSVENMRNIE